MEAALVFEEVLERNWPVIKTVWMGAVSLMPNNSPEPTAVGAGRSAGAVPGRWPSAKTRRSKRLEIFQQRRFFRAGQVGAVKVALIAIAAHGHIHAPAGVLGFRAAGDEANIHRIVNIVAAIKG